MGPVSAPSLKGQDQFVKYVPHSFDSLVHEGTIDCSLESLLNYFYWRSKVYTLTSTCTLYSALTLLVESMRLYFDTGT